MSDKEANLLNGGKGNRKNGVNNKRAARNRPALQTQKSMDIEYHAHLDDIDQTNGSRTIVYDRPSEEFGKKNNLTEIIDIDSDEDTFADAESDCEPNQFFLDEMLEDEHPERLSLFDYRKKEQEKNKEGSSRTLSSSDAHNDEHDIGDSSTSRRDESAEVDELLRQMNIDDESITDHSDENGLGDSVSHLPTISNKGRGRLSTGTSPAVGPGMRMLRQPSKRTVWGK